MAILFRQSEYEMPKKTPKKEKIKSSEVIGASMKVLDGINKASETLLNESGWLDSPDFGFEDTTNGSTVQKRIFSRKKGEGNFISNMLRKPQDRIKINSDGEKYFQSLHDNGDSEMPITDYYQYVMSKGEGNEGLMDLVGGKEGVKKTVAANRRMNLAKLETEAKGKALLDETLGNLERERSPLSYTTSNVPNEPKPVGPEGKLTDIGRKYDSSTEDRIGVKKDFLSNQGPTLGSNINSSRSIGQFKPQSNASLVSQSNIRPNLLDPNPGGFSGMQNNFGAELDSKHISIDKPMYDELDQTKGPGGKLGKFMDAAQNNKTIKVGGKLMDAANILKDPKKALKDKAVGHIKDKAITSLIGSAALGPAGIAVDLFKMFGGKLFKKHTLMGKIFG